MTEQEMQFKLMKSKEKVNALRQEVADLNKAREYRHQVRIQFVGQIASAIIGNYEFYSQGIAKECKRSGKSRPEMIAQMSLEITDALIEGLEKREQDESKN